MNPLPDTDILAEIAEITSEDVAEKLRVTFPSLSVYFGPRPKPDSLLVRAIGAEAAAELGQYFGGAWVFIPSGRQAMKVALGRERREMIRELAATGLKRVDIALKVGCSERYVYYALREDVPDPNQGDLFRGWPEDQAA